MPAVLGGLIEFEVGQGVRASGMWKMHIHTHTRTHIEFWNGKLQGN